jgi:hypothetical protein
MPGGVPAEGVGNAAAVGSDAEADGRGREHLTVQGAP